MSISRRTFLHLSGAAAAVSAAGMPHPPQAHPHRTVPIAIARNVRVFLHHHL
ncbi:MAG: twin-arginine translocation signal domain-containing protein [Bacteroidetes bacterium SB0662_bin_6]|nr:twin-arginine translocation signal domain-containing protein [Bacteroidetes bacterium SB0668_bin_1]MYE04937.1 twin-arginine translocation signal domain-containing protein [Bacteroidetes bacterium SB0662_bin_6]